MHKSCAFRNKFCNISEGYTPVLQGMKPACSNKLKLSKAIYLSLWQEQWIMKPRFQGHSHLSVNCICKKLRIWCVKRDRVKSSEKWRAGITYHTILPSNSSSTSSTNKNRFHFYCLFVLSVP